MDSRSEEMTQRFTLRFKEYFEREIAQKAASSLVENAQMGFVIQDAGKPAVEHFHFSRSNGKNSVYEGPAPEPQMIYTLTGPAADAVLGDTSQEIATIGINIMKLILSPDPTRKISVKVRAGFLELFTKGYFGVVATGGQQFATYLASAGFNGLGAIKAAIKNLKSD